MTNFIVLVLTLTVFIFIFECPRHGRAEDNTSEGLTVNNATEILDQHNNKNDSRDGKQFWPLIPSPPFLIAQPPHLVHFTMPAQPQARKEALPPAVAMARGISPQTGVSPANPLVSESDLFSKFTRAVERKLPEEVTGRFSGEPEKSGLTLERSGSDIYAGKPRVRSIMSPEEEEDVPAEAESRSNGGDDDLELVESVSSGSSLIGSILPRHSNAHYYSEDSTDDLQLPSARRESIVNKHLKPSDCCLFIFLDGSAFYFDDFLRKLTGYYRLMHGTVNNHPHYVSRNCKNPDEYNGSCTYIWYSGYGWVVGVGRYIGQTKGVIYTRQEETCPSGLNNWRYLNEDIEWKDNGNIYVECAT